MTKIKMLAAAVAVASVSTMAGAAVPPAGGAFVRHGLGLPLTRALVEANRAYFELESTLGEGTVVHVLFPSQRVLAD